MKKTVGTVKAELAAELHEMWRRDYIATHGNVSRMKTTKDAAWIALHDTDQVDINQPYEFLPEDWQRENRAAADAAIDLTYAKLVGRNGTPLGEEDIAEIASDIHEAWLTRNTWVYDPVYGNPKLAKPYGELSQEEKDKDLLHVRLAMEHIQKSLL